MTFVLSLAFLSARPARSFFLLLTIPPPPTSNVWLPIKIHFFHFSPESDIPSGFLCFPISSVSLSHPSSTHWHVFFHRSPSHLCHLFPLPSLLTIALSDHLRKEWNSVPSPPFLSRVGGKSCVLPSDRKCHFFFLHLYFPMSTSPNWDNTNLFWQPTYTDKLLMDGHGCRIVLASVFHQPQEGVCFLNPQHCI